MEGISLEALLEEELLLIPPLECKGVEEFYEGDKFTFRSGVYTFYNKYGQPLYVGISNKVNKRIMEHIQSLKGNQDLQHYLKNNPDCHVKAFHEPDKTKQEIYEGYLIMTLNPRFNIGKTGREKVWKF